MKNIELFDDYTGAILALLYQSFPVPATLDARKLCGHGEIDEFGRIVDDMGRPSKSFEIAISTLGWLESAGFISSRQKNHYGHMQVTLTVQGLQLLNDVPDALKSKEPTGEKLVRFIREGSPGLARETEKAVIAAGDSAGLS
ncbi:MAG: hypothetical protein P8X77_16745 [Maritimibacter sp.]